MRLVVCEAIIGQFGIKKLPTPFPEMRQLYS